MPDSIHSSVHMHAAPSADLWSDVKQSLQDELPSQQFNTWIRPLAVSSTEGSGVRLEAPNRFIRDWVSDKYGARINALLNTAMQGNWDNNWLTIDVAHADATEVMPTNNPRPANGAGRHRDAISVSGVDNSATTSSSGGGSTLLASDHTHQPSSLPGNSLLSSPHDKQYARHADRHAHLHGTESQPLAESSLPDALNAEADSKRPVVGSTSSDGSVVPSTRKPIVAKPAAAVNHEGNLISNYRFDNFVEGKSNQLARAAAMQVADNPGGAYNPLFLYGGVGLGKTHLMHAVGNALKARKPDAKVIYLHSERFVADMVKALQLNAINDFKRYYRSVDALLIDDIQFFANKERSQEEFFHTFNALLEGGQQMILTCDRYPKEINGVEERLRSRFGWGLTVAVEPPELETRVAILIRKAEQSNIVLPNDAAFFLAQRVRSNVRELEGALKRVIAHAHFMKSPIDIALIKESLKDLLALQDKQISIDNIQRTTAEYYKIKVADLMSKRRNRSVARPRQVAMALAKELTSHSLPEIGDAFGGRDHTTVLHACRKVKELRETSKDIGEDYQNLLRTLAT